MRLIATLIILLSTASLSPAQKLTGVWRGFFMQRDYDPMSRSFVEDQYNYEIQINNELAKDAIEGVTYSFFTTVFYGKAAMKGVYTRATKNLVIKETKMLDLKIGDNSVPCLMTCYLDYSKAGGKEILSGTYTSVNTSKKQDCGSGTVYLEKVPESKFKKEDFLLALEAKNKGNNKLSALLKPEAPKASPPATKKTVAKATPTAPKTTILPPAKTVAKPPVVVYAKPKQTKAQASPQQPAMAATKPATLPSAAAQTAPQKTAPQTIEPTEKPVMQQPREVPVQKHTPPPPPELVQRMDQLVRTIEVNEPDILIEFYDNGEIDNDTISVYHNNTRVVKDGRLAYRPITVKIHCTEPNEQHEIVVVAENLGDIAPNTALMVVTVGKKRYEVFLSTTEQKNARVVFQYKPKG
jgi:hypothetical protein